MRFRPEFLIPVLVDVRNLLDRTPAENGVMANEGGDIAICNGVFDRRIDQVCEEGDAVFKVGVNNLHYA